MKFSWNHAKNLRNKLQHGISFEEAIAIFDGTEEIEFDCEHSTHDEDRYRAYGRLPRYGSVVVVFIEVIDDEIRIISAYRVKNET